MDAPLQSVVHAAAGSPAAALGSLGLVLYIGGAVLLLLVVALALHGVLSPRRQLRPEWWLLGGGIVLPVTLLSLLLWQSLVVGRALTHEAPADAVRIRITGWQWWWEVEYPAADGGARAVLANELRVPAGRPVHLELLSGDVIHSFWVPSLAGKVDMIPGRRTHLVFQSSETGIYRGACAEYCGGQHARMGLYVVVESGDDFRAWRQREAEDARLPGAGTVEPGYRLFFRGECHTCHAVRGTPAAGDTGPDLTHIGSRLSLGAGILGNHPGAMAGWIAGSQDLKPGNAMPSAEGYSGEELRVLTAWLQALE